MSDAFAASQTDDPLSVWHSWRGYLRSFISAPAGQRRGAVVMWSARQCFSSQPGTERGPGTVTATLTHTHTHSWLSHGAVGPPLLEDVRGGWRAAVRRVDRDTISMLFFLCSMHIYLFADLLMLLVLHGNLKQIDLLVSYAKRSCEEWQNQTTAKLAYQGPQFHLARVGS